MFGAARQPATVAFDAGVGQLATDPPHRGVQLDQRPSPAQQLDDQRVAAAVGLDPAHLQLFFLGDHGLGRRPVRLAPVAQRRRQAADEGAPVGGGDARSIAIGVRSGAQLADRDGHQPQQRERQLDGRTGVVSAQRQEAEAVAAKAHPRLVGEQLDGGVGPPEKREHVGDAGDRAERRQLHPQAIKGAGLDQIEPGREADHEQRRERRRHDAAATSSDARGAAGATRETAPPTPAAINAASPTPAISVAESLPCPHPRPRMAAAWKRPGSDNSTTPTLTRGSVREQANAIAVSSDRNPKLVSR